MLRNLAASLSSRCAGPSTAAVAAASHKTSSPSPSWRPGPSAGGFITSQQYGPSTSAAAGSPQIIIRQLSSSAASASASLSSSSYSIPTMNSATANSEAEMIQSKYTQLFSQPDITTDVIRKGLLDLQDENVIPEPNTVKAALLACDRVREYELASRFLEAVRIKCGRKYAMYSWILDEVRPVIKEIGISDPEEPRIFSFVPFQSFTFHL